MPESNRELRRQRRLAREQAHDARDLSELAARYCKYFGVGEPHIPHASDLRKVVAEVVDKDHQFIVWDNHAGPYPVLDDVLLFTAQAFDASKGSFLRLFKTNLRRRVRRDRQRMAGDALGEANSRAAYVHERRGGVLDEVEVSYTRWMSYLFEEAVARLDPKTALYIRLRLRGVSVQDIARQLGVCEKTLWNKFGGDIEKQGRRVRRELRKMLTGLPVRHLHLLARHLRDEAGLPQKLVESLLQMPIDGLNLSVPLLDEEAILELLGWTKKF